MIKINLLPTTKKAKRRKPAKKMTPFQQEIAAYIFLLLVAGGALGFFGYTMQIRIYLLQKDLEEAEAKIKRQEAMLKEVKGLEEEEKAVQKRIEVIKKLEENQTGPVKLVDDVSRRLPKGVGLVTMDEKGGNVKLEGMAFTNHDLVNFVENLKRSPLLTDVYLLSTQQEKLEGVEVYKFLLQFRFKGA